MSSKLPVPVVEVDNLEVATSVIRAIRSSSGSQQRYQLYARSNGVMVDGVGELNHVIEKQRQKVLAQNVRQNKLIEAINNYGPSQDSPYGSPAKGSPSQRDKSSVDRRDDSEENYDDIVPSKGVVERDSDDELLNDDDDMRELMSGFVAPKSSLSTYTNSVSMSTTLLDGENQNPRRLNPIKQSTSVDVANASLKKGIIIKPGQAIRVKASSKHKKS